MWANGPVKGFVLLLPLLWKIMLVMPLMGTTIFKSYAPTASRGNCKVDSSPLQ